MKYCRLCRKLLTDNTRYGLTDITDMIIHIKIYDR